MLYIKLLLSPMLVCSSINNNGIQFPCHLLFLLVTAPLINNICTHLNYQTLGMEQQVNAICCSWYLNIDNTSHIRR